MQVSNNNIKINERGDIFVLGQQCKVPCMVLEFEQMEWKY